MTEKRIGIPITSREVERRREKGGAHGPAPGGGGYFFSLARWRISAAISLISVRLLCISLHPYHRA